eukprot:gene27208-2454_t
MSIEESSNTLSLLHRIPRLDDSGEGGQQLAEQLGTSLTTVNYGCPFRAVDAGAESSYSRGFDECSNQKRQRYVSLPNDGPKNYPGTSFPCHEDAWLHPCRSCNRFTSFEHEANGMVFPLCRGCKDSMLGMSGNSVAAQNLQLSPLSLAAAQNTQLSPVQTSGIWGPSSCGPSTGPSVTSDSECISLCSPPTSSSARTTTYKAFDDEL